MLHFARACSAIIIESHSFPRLCPQLPVTCVTSMWLHRDDPVTFGHGQETLASFCSNFPLCVNFTHHACECSRRCQCAVAECPQSGGFCVGTQPALKKTKSQKFYMARKLYIFTPTTRVKVDGPQNSFKWLGGFTTSYTFLGDHQARLLGVGNRIISRRMPAWAGQSGSNGKSARGGASRHDPSFRGWG